MLPTINIPTLLLYGDKDVRSPFSVAEEMHAGIPGSRLVVILGAVYERHGGAGSLQFRGPQLAECGGAAVVVEGDYPDLFRTQPGRGSWLADMLGRLAARYAEVPIIFAGSRKVAEEWAYRFFGAAVGDTTGQERDP